MLSRGKNVIQCINLKSATQAVSLLFGFFQTGQWQISWEESFRAFQSEQTVNLCTTTLINLAVYEMIRIALLRRGSVHVSNILIQRRERTTVASFIRLPNKKKGV